MAEMFRQNVQKFNNFNFNENRSRKIVKFIVFGLQYTFIHFDEFDYKFVSWELIKKAKLK